MLLLLLRPQDTGAAREMLTAWPEPGDSWRAELNSLTEVRKLRPKGLLIPSHGFAIPGAVMKHVLALFNFR